MASGSLLHTSIIFALLNVEMPMSNPNMSNKQVLHHFRVSGAWQYSTQTMSESPRGQMQFSVPFLWFWRLVASPHS